MSTQTEIPEEDKHRYVSPGVSLPKLSLTARSFLRVISCAALYFPVTYYFPAWYHKTIFLYICWYFCYDTAKTGGRASPWVRQWTIFRRIAGYFPALLEKTCDLDPNEKYVLGCHPHGICIGAALNFATEATGFSQIFPDIKPHLVTLSGNHRMPGARELLRYFGTSDASPENIDYILQNRGNMVIIVVGGTKETFFMDHKAVNLVLNKRKGFVRMAIKHGAHLVPCFTFGETFVYKVHHDVFPGWFSRWFKRISGHTPKVFSGLYGFIPFKTPLNTVVGRPISVVQDSNPSREKIDALHAVYVEQLRDLYDKHKERFGMENIPLTLVD
ncbi:acyl-CoA wax alcohol acyltransferase 1-like isoform X1 [Paramacrobiotus metropolitanus]|uniref:acyl-CoA wax alcohol acyltransferase 1-like isoform X1 n=2 Tax=Paramacrobiotus metropolitanus TaxID=2943436 RepID=UPI00244631E5|nr:acyl-CoA wax alcohol acyltransferase 1-like isoform X1 [Paramacrobiotus metropolitanus]